MYFTKYLHASNFEFIQSVSGKDNRFPSGRRTHKLSLSDLGDDIHRLTVTGGPWNTNESKAEYFPDGRPDPADSSVTGALAKKPLGLEWKDRRGSLRLRTLEGRGFGVCGDSWIMGFALDGSETFYGMGEKYLGLELSGKRTKFWNTDIFGDFHHHQVAHGRVDPAYVSIPYLIINTGKGWVGVLVNNPGAVMMDTGAKMDIEGFLETSEGGRYLLIGADAGQPDLYFLFADSLAELTRKYQHMVGTTPLPPVWSLGYHQCRWGYRAAAELAEYKARFKKEKIPVDGLWLDIDYMRGYRVFTFNSEHFPSVEEDLAALQDEGQRVVPIIDPGVKIDPDWEVYRDGLKRDVYSKNPQGKTFVGQVWPGDTAFVDYTLKDGSEWWADRVAEFAARGIHGCWNDMNDPSLGFVESTPMLWNKGRKPHWTYHNQFAAGMAEATRKGFLKAHPEERPFILSRSGSTGMARFAAIWHGDSVSNYHWLGLCVPTALNLSLSGVPFNGPDLGGFGDDTTTQLMMDYVKACFLFPFCRNHTAIHTRRQEPWEFGGENTRIIGDYIRARYKLRPYLYQLFVRQEEHGDPVLRPLFYEFPKRGEPDFSRLEDQFMVGPALMHAPLLSEARSRTVVLPKGRWFNFMTSRWIEGGRDLKVKPADDATPLFGRAGESIVTTPDTPTTHHWNGKALDVHLFLEPGRKGKVSGEVATDDGIGFGYRDGERTRIAYTAKTDGETLSITTRTLQDGYGEIDLGFALYGRFKKVTLNRREVKPVKMEYSLAGRSQTVYRVE